MNSTPSSLTLWDLLENISNGLESKRLADVARLISFYPGETYGPHKHLRIEINYVKSGSCVLTLNDEAVIFNEGEMMIILSEATHMFQAGHEGCTLMQLEFLPEIFERFNLGRALTDAFPFYAEAHNLIKIVRNVRMMRVVQRIINELTQKGAYFSQLVVLYYAELFLLIQRYLKENYLPMCNNEGLKEAVTYLRMNYQKNLSVHDVSDHVHISERYLRALFQRYLNQSPLDYLNHIRINKAIELLRNTELSIKEVCYMCGFQSPQYFSRIFKKQTGVTPRQLTK